MVGWLVFNGTFSTNRLYCVIFAQEINPIPTLDRRLNQDSNSGPSAVQESAVNIRLQRLTDTTNTLKDRLEKYWFNQDIG